MTTASLLLELHTEELPPRALAAMSAAFAAGIEQGLRARRFLCQESAATAFGAPRRLAVHIGAVKARSDDQRFRTRLMPVAVARSPAGGWTPALGKKLAALGHARLAELPAGADDDGARLVVDGNGKDESVFLEGVSRGLELAPALQHVLEETLAALPIPKAMSYQLADGSTTVQFARPAHRLVALHGDSVLAVSVLGLQAGRRTFGHRFHARGEIEIRCADSYEEQMLAQGKVISSFEARRRRIAELVAEAARALGAHALMPAELLDEVTALVEWPVVYACSFDSEFLSLPAECLILTMQRNQRYFALKDDAGRLLARFLLVSQIEAKDPSAIVAGNARVVRARLADARFFYDQDRKSSLESRIPGLANVVYHSRLGSQLERVERLTGIAVEIGRRLGADATHVERAARLAKADLRTLMVGEFPELQGIMGTYYARHDGEPADVAAAIEEHYRPRFAGDLLPVTRIGACVALADKLETLVGLFAIGERPSGDRDPFALRRHALGVLRILIELRLPLELDAALAIARRWHEADGPHAARAAADASGDAAARARPRFEAAVLADLETFLFDRLRGLLREEGYSAHEVESVLANRPQRIDDVPARLAAVRAFLALPEADSLAAANKRIGNILKKADAPPAALDAALLFEPAEQELAAAFERVRPLADSRYAAGDYTAMLAALAPLKLPVDRFFDHVLVNVDEPRLRANRLALLAALRAQMNRVADLSLLSSG
jgi:glycyl-tRNA synthetase beta chain